MPRAGDGLAPRERIAGRHRLYRHSGRIFLRRLPPVGRDGGALTVENSQSTFTARYEQGEKVRFPVAHHDGNYTADSGTLARLEGEGRIAFRYAEAVNGSAKGIAGILNDAGNVLGMMPHPERVIEAAHGNSDGRRLFEGLLEAVA